jgi:hypothetical protein
MSQRLNGAEMITWFMNHSPTDEAKWKIEAAGTRLIAVGSDGQRHELFIERTAESSDAGYEAFVDFAVAIGMELPRC